MSNGKEKKKEWGGTLVYMRERKSKPDSRAGGLFRSYSQKNCVFCKSDANSRSSGGTRESVLKREYGEYPGKERVTVLAFFLPSLSQVL